MIIKQAIFDLDGTLLETMDSIIKAGNAMLSRLGYEPRSREEYKLFVGYGAKQLVKNLLRASGDVHESRLEEAYPIYMEIFDETCTYKVRPYPGMTELISYLADHGIKLAVLTNKPHSMAARVVNSVFPINTFTIIQGLDDSFPRKPDPTAALHIAKELGAVDLKQVMFMGDSDADMQTAVNAGMLPVGASWGFRTGEELVANGCEILLEKPLDLIDRLTGDQRG